MKANFTQAGKSVMSPIDGPVHWLPISSVPNYFQNLSFYNVGYQVVRRY